MIPAFVNDLRRARGLMTIDEIVDLVARGNVVFDPFSTLIAVAARIGTGNVFHPCITVDCAPGGELVIGDDNVFHANSTLLAETGPVVIGSGNRFGEGGFVAKANRAGADIRIGDHGRYLGGVSVYGHCRLGSGSQILGAITADDCRLDGGASHSHSDPDERAGLLKGSGVARGLVVRIGHVIVGNGAFRQADEEAQSRHHPRR